MQRKENTTSLPDNLKSGIENLSGYSMDDVKVHYNSTQPAQLNALAYAQGTDIHVAPGQEKHLAHEAWHVVQQKQGRVKPTKQMKQQVPLNDDAELESEADTMGAKALNNVNAIAQAKRNQERSQDVIQRIGDITMGASKKDLADSQKRFQLVNLIYSALEKNFLLYKLTGLVEGKNFLKGKDYTHSGSANFKALGDADQTAVVKELLAKQYHDDVASAEITEEMRSKLGRGIALTEGEDDTDGPDITASTVTPANKKTGKEQVIASNLTSSKACVITGLMFAEGGGVLGAKSVEELHFILSTRFRTTWRHYSEDQVYASLYRHMGYTATTPDEETILERISTVTADYSHGMASIEGHIVGLKKEGPVLHLRDNDEGLKLPTTHSKKGKNILEVWHK